MFVILRLCKETVKSKIPAPSRGRVLSWLCAALSSMWEDAAVCQIGFWTGCEAIKIYPLQTKLTSPGCCDGLWWGGRRCMGGCSPAPHTIIPQVLGFTAPLLGAASRGYKGWVLLAQGTVQVPSPAAVLPSKVKTSCLLIQTY